MTTAAELSRGTAGGARRSRVRDLLVVGQVAATMLLVVTALLLVRSFDALRQINPGFTTERVMSVQLAIPRTTYRTDARIAAFCRQILERVSAIPGVESAGMVNRLPFAGGIQNGEIEFEGIDPARTRGTTDWRSVTPDYFGTLGIPLRAGRGFTDADTADRPLVGIIDERLAASVFPGQDAVGRRFRMAFPGVPWITIVGVVGHIHHERLDQDSRPQVYWPAAQRAQDRMALVVRTRGEPASFAQPIATAVREVDPDQPLYDVRPLAAVVDRSLARRWLQTTLLGVFAALALALACIGVYGAIAYGVGQRLREFGIRLALGARRGDIVAEVVGRGVTLFAAGAVLGGAGTAAAVRVLRRFLYDVGPFDPVSFGVATLVLFVVTFAACAVPARRAGRVDPTVALRAE